MTIHGTTDPLLPAPEAKGTTDRSLVAPGTHRLPRKVLRLWHINTVLTCLVLVGVIVGIARWWDHPVIGVLFWPVVGLVVLVGVADLVFGNLLRHRHYSYTVTEQEVYVAKGLLIRHTMNLAVPQILSIHVISGPLQRLFGLASVRFTCVVEGESLGPVPAHEAERIKRVVLTGLERRRQESALTKQSVPSDRLGNNPVSTDTVGSA
ncbi:PH domain-containing protein [uncultured Arthrobacter sp.]|uniref:PH domain-containing protein n=1 Tax=uncultured Arthrobacter sp. TaxID=114050 RepID=UPI00260E9641|nr:PH domain-containing protein [uncultured Arthrobacter sp.]